MNTLKMRSRMMKVITFGIVIILALSISALAAQDLQGLISSSPVADRADKLKLFGQFVGDWEFDYIGYGRDGTKFTGKGEWHFGWVLEGRAVQDVWIIPSRSERNKAGATLGEYGTTVRFYDPKIDAWRVVWNGPVRGEMVTFIARKVGDEIVMEGKDTDGSPTRWIFSKITGQSFYQNIGEDPAHLWLGSIRSNLGGAFQPPSLSALYSLYAQGLQVQTACLAGG